MISGIVHKILLNKAQERELWKVDFAHLIDRLRGHFFIKVTAALPSIYIEYSVPVFRLGEEKTMVCAERESCGMFPE